MNQLTQSQKPHLAASISPVKAISLGDDWLPAKYEPR